MLCLYPLYSPPSLLYPPCSVCPAHSLLPLPLPYNQKSFSQMCMLALPSIIHHQSFGRARDDGLATWEILQRVTAPAQNHRWERSPASFFEQCRQCNSMAIHLCSAIGSAIGGMLASNSLLSSLSSHLSLALLFSSHAIADMPSSISISTSPQEKSLSPHPNPHSLISIHFLLSIPTQILRASQNSRVTIDLCLNLFDFHLFNIEFHFFSIFYQKKKEQVLASSEKKIAILTLSLRPP